MAWKWRRLPDLLTALFRVSPEGTQFSVIVFGERVLEKIEFGHSRHEIQSTIDRFAVRPGTWLVTREPKRVVRDSLLDAYDLLQPAQAGDSIIVATDEPDDDSKMSEKTLGNKFSSEGIRFFVMRIGDPYPQDRTLLHNELELLSAATGGAEVSIASPNQREGTARNVADEIVQYYLI